MRAVLVSAAVAACAVASAPALADFAGQTILGTLTNGSVVTGNTTGATDDNDGFTSGKHIFDLWDGGDDVWTIDWAGGNLLVTLTYDNSGGTDLDLFVYRPGSLNDSGDYSIVNTGVETVSITNAAPGLYYVNIDSPAGGEGAYELSVTVPTPATALVGLVGFGALSRRRR